MKRTCDVLIVVSSVGWIDIRADKNIWNGSAVYSVSDLGNGVYVVTFDARYKLEDVLQDILQVALDAGLTVTVVDKKRGTEVTHEPVSGGEYASAKTSENGGFLLVSSNPYSRTILVTGSKALLEKLDKFISDGRIPHAESHRTTRRTNVYSVTLGIGISHIYAARSVAIGIVEVGLPVKLDDELLERR